MGVVLDSHVLCVPACEGLGLDCVGVYRLFNLKKQVCIPYSSTAWCVFVCVSCHKRSFTHCCHLVTNLVSTARVETRHLHLQTHTYTHTLSWYGNVNSVSPENVGFDLTMYLSFLLPLLCLPLFSLLAILSSFSSSLLNVSFVFISIVLNRSSGGKIESKFDI